ncbi:MAG TPA: N-acetylmuramoyl-L-alanine amidase [Thermoanaerobaculia bacterium]|nr:N-acetylmuramoyl-L-alanine amidase [Thermoanaerobaculia bacterium]
MKRIAAVLAILLLAQTPTTAVLRTPQGDKPVGMLAQNGIMYFAADDVLAALGGSVKQDANGFKATLGSAMAAFGPDSRFAVVREDLIEMPVPPLVVDGKPYVVLQFFQGFLSRAGDLELVWDPTARVLQSRTVQRGIVGVQSSVANIQGISKVVLTLTAPAEYTIIKEPGAYTVRFKAQLKAPAPEQAFDDPYVKSVAVAGTDLRIQLTTPDVAADTYRLDNPFRIVIDLRKGAAPAPGTTPPAPVTKPVEQPGIHTIVIDPGHGGKEVGAIGPGGLMEKDATLALCQKLHDALEAKLHARVVLTRTDDSVVSLDQRTAIANQYHADLFLSVHMNAAVVKGAKGSETYFLSLEASDELAKKAAETENAAERAPANDLKLILWDLAQQQYLQESSRFAQNIQEEMNRLHGITNRGVKQAPFKVLVGATMPAALVEVAFITNPTEEAKIKSEDFQKNVVDALTTAVDRYKTDYETRIGIAPAPAAPTPAQGTVDRGQGTGQTTKPPTKPATTTHLSPVSCALSPEKAGT